MISRIKGRFKEPSGAWIPNLINPATVFKTRTDACDTIQAEMKTHPTPDDMSSGAYCFKDLVCGNVDQDKVRTGDQYCGFLTNSLSIGMLFICLFLKS